MAKQKINKIYANSPSWQRNCSAKQLVSQVSVTTSTAANQSNCFLMEQVVEQSNMQRAWSKVKSNKGAAGVDGLNISQTGKMLAERWPAIKQQLLAGHYKPDSVLRVEIPKAKGGIRKLGIPTVLDRLIQQAITQVLQPIFDPGFSQSSFGFRPNRSAQMAVRQTQRYFNQGYRWVVDMDLEQFFDRVNHDILMSKISLKVKDNKLLGVIRRYLQSGVLIDGVMSQSPKGTPQGGPLSPLLSNIMLDELDKELESRGHKFSRYADDCNIYVASQRAGKRVLESISNFLSDVLKLKVNQAKSTVARPWKRSFLGYSVTFNRRSKLKPSKESIQRFKAKVKVLMRIGRGRNLARFISNDLNPLLRGWANYFKISETKQIFDQLDSWIRRRLRCIRWRQWKWPKIRKRKLVKRGLSQEHAARSAYNGRGPWFNSGASHMNLAFAKLYFERLNLISLAQIISQADWLK